MFKLVAVSSPFSLSLRALSREERASINHSFPLPTHSLTCPCLHEGTHLSHPIPPQSLHTLRALEYRIVLNLEKTRNLIWATSLPLEPRLKERLYTAERAPNPSSGAVSQHRVSVFPHHELIVSKKCRSFSIQLNIYIIHSLCL